MPQAHLAMHGYSGSTPISIIDLFFNAGGTNDVMDTARTDASVSQSELTALSAFVLL